MKQAIQDIGIMIFIILVLFSAGCITPPKGSTSSAPAGSSHSPSQTPTITVPTPNYVTEVTPYPVKRQAGTSSTGYTVFPQSTPIPDDQSCLISFSTNTYAYNKTAFSFNLKNPPMYINYSVIPTNITVNKYVEANTGGNQMITLTFSDYSPNSWFEVTVRNKTTGEIYKDDGFGTAKQLSTYTDGTIKVMNSGDLQIEYSGNLITATAGVWVKPYGNLDANQTPPTECKYWESNPRNSLYMATATATPTWAP